jgi:hypothetical protein
MGASVRPEATDNPRLARIRQLTAAYKAQGATAQEISELIDQHHPEVRATAEGELAREPMGVGGIVRGAAANLGEGVGFSMADEVMGGVRGVLDPRISMAEGVDEVRGERDRFAEAYPKTALGLTIGGAALPAVLTAGASAGAPSMAARVVGSGAASGAIAGYGSGEGGPTSGSRLGRAAVGGVAGAALGAAAPRIASAFPESVAGGQMVTDDVLSRIAQRAAPTASRSAPAASGVASTARTPQVASQVVTTESGFGEPSIRAAGRALGNPERGRSLLAELQGVGMGDNALTLNVAENQNLAARAARAAANQPNSDAGRIVNERLARQGGRLGEQVAGNPRLGIAGDIAESTGMPAQFPEVVVSDMQTELGKRVQQRYDAFAARGDLARGAMADDAQKLATILGDDATAQEFSRYIATAKRNPDLAGLPDTDAKVMLDAFHLLQSDVRAAGRGTDAVVTRTRQTLRDNVLRALGQVDPDVEAVTRQYAMDADVGKVVQDAFESGRGIKTPGQAIVGLRETTDAGQRAMRAGNVAELQSMARRRGSNADLEDLAQFRDVARAVIGTPEARETFIAMHGEDAYDAMLARLRPKIAAAVQNAAARGNSTTTQQALEALAFGDDAMLDGLNSLISSSPATGAIGWLGRQTVDRAGRAMRLGVGRTATETADLLTREGPQEIGGVLEMIARLQAEDVAKKALVSPVVGTAARASVGAGRP